MPESRCCAISKIPYFNDPKIDSVNKTLFVFASYNAGPNRIVRLRKEASDMGLDPNVWFGNVELVAGNSSGWSAR
jgi:membrane-bound lytic murein transglycosylase MltF